MSDVNCFLTFMKMKAEPAFCVNGDFAAVCVGRQDGRITLIRDHLGIRRFI